MEPDVNTIEKFWRSLVTVDGLANSLLSTFRVSHSEEIKALALLTRVTFLLTVGMKNGRDDALRNEEYLLSEIIKIGKNCSNNTCCQKTKLALHNLFQNFKQQHVAQDSDATSTSHDAFQEELTVPKQTKSHEKMEILFNSQNVDKNTLVNKLDTTCKHSSLETQIPEIGCIREDVCASPETIIIENSEYGSATIFEKTPTKDFGRILAHCNENLKEEMGDIDDGLLREKQTVKNKAKNEVFCSSKNLYRPSSPVKIKVGYKLGNLECELPTHSNLNSDFSQCFSLQSTDKSLTPRLESQNDNNKSIGQSTASAGLTATEISTTVKIIDTPGYKLNDDHFGSNTKELTSNKIGKQNLKLFTSNQDNLNNKLSSSPLQPPISKCFTPEFISNSLSILAHGKSLSPQVIQLNLPGSKLSTLTSTPGKLSNLCSNDFVGFTVSPKHDHNVSFSEVSRSSTDIICSMSSNPVDEHTSSKLSNIKNPSRRTQKQKKSPILRRNKSIFCTLPIFKAKVTPLPKARTDFHTSKINAEISFTPSPINDTKKMLRQTTLTQDFFLGKSKETKITSTEESLETKVKENMLRRKKDKVMKLKCTEKVNSSAIKITSSDESEEDLFISSGEVTKDDNLLTTLKKSTKKHHSFINSNEIENQTLSFENKYSSLSTVSNVEINLNDGLKSLGAKDLNAKLNEEGDILAHSEVGFQVLDKELEFSNSFTPSKRRGRRLNEEGEILAISEVGFQVPNKQLEFRNSFSSSKRRGKRLSEDGEILAQSEVGFQVLNKRLEFNNSFTPSKRHGKRLNEEEAILAQSEAGFQVLDKQLEFSNSFTPSKKRGKRLNEDGEILAQSEVDFQVLDKKREFSNSFTSSKRRGKRLEDSFDFIPPEVEDPSLTYKRSLIQKKPKKHKVEGYKSHERKTLTEEQDKKKMVISGADWDLFNEYDEAPFENFLSQNEIKTKKNESKASSFSGSYVAYSTEKGRNMTRMNYQDISLSKDEKKKEKKSKKRLNFMKAEFDAIDSMQKCIQLRKKEKINRKNYEITSAKLESKASSCEECGVDTLIVEERLAKTVKRHPEILTSIDAKKKKIKRKHKSSDAEFDSSRVARKHKKMRKEKKDHSEDTKLYKKEIKVVEKENSICKIGKKHKSIINTPKINLDTTQNSSIIYEGKKKRKKFEEVKCNYSEKDWWHVYV